VATRVARLHGRILFIDCARRPYGITRSMLGDCDRFRPFYADVEKKVRSEGVSALMGEVKARADDLVNAKIPSGAKSKSFVQATSKCCALERSAFAGVWAIRRIDPRKRALRLSPTFDLAVRKGWQNNHGCWGGLYLVPSNPKRMWDGGKIQRIPMTPIILPG